jgi:SAM-dependent methyltransferase
MQSMPFGDDTFDLVTGFNSFFFADDIVAALREARRVARPRGTVVVQVWGHPDQCALTPMKDALAPFLPPPPRDARPQPALWEPGVLEAIVAEAGLTARETFTTSWSFEFADDDALVRGLLAAANAELAARAAGRTAVAAAILQALAPARRPDGGYALANEWRYAIASA